MRTLLVIVGVLTLTPVLVRAQSSRGMPPPGSRADSPLIRVGPRVVKFTGAALERLVPARVLTDHRKELELTQAEQARLDSLTKPLVARVSIYIKRTDSLERLITAGNAPAPRNGVATKGDSAKLATWEAKVEKAQAARREYLATLVRLKDDFDTTAVHAMAVVSDAHRDRAKELVSWAIDDLAALLHRTSLQAQRPVSAGRRGGP